MQISLLPLPIVLLPKENVFDNYIFYVPSNVLKKLCFTVTSRSLDELKLGGITERSTVTTVKISGNTGIQRQGKSPSVGCLAGTPHTERVSLGVPKWRAAVTFMAPPWGAICILYTPIFSPHGANAVKASVDLNSDGGLIAPRVSLNQHVDCWQVSKERTARYGSHSGKAAEKPNNCMVTTVIQSQRVRGPGRVLHTLLDLYTLTRLDSDLIPATPQGTVAAWVVRINPSFVNVAMWGHLSDINSTVGRTVDADQVCARHQSLKPSRTDCEYSSALSWFSPDQLHYMSVPLVEKCGARAALTLVVHSQVQSGRQEPGKPKCGVDIVTTTVSQLAPKDTQSAPVGKLIRSV
ncbi:hypothetical protein BaRGS_00019177 [Batillaria attramentaria]|uniref:Uncharacterized protein n=1 Tax=Batillaria attramentaria TaxID=370345 RepID=A0ABD0KRS2_9CAEN